jgi:hypothetical protein
LPDEFRAVFGEFRIQGFVERRDTGSGCFGADFSLGWRRQQADGGNCDAGCGYSFHGGSKDLIAAPAGDMRFSR